MFGFSRRHQKPVDRKRSLAGVPVLNEGVRCADNGPDRVKVTVRIRRGHGFLARFQPPVMERNVELDELGTFVLRQIDGERTASEIIDVFRERYGVNRREAELSCVAFLKSLLSRQVISIGVK